MDGRALRNQVGRLADRLVRAIPFLDRKTIWSIGIREGESPFDLYDVPGVSNPVLTRRDVTDIRAQFLADPFLYHDGVRWYLFFEVFNKRKGRGEIGVATSDDGTVWRYERVVLREPFHLSFPGVIGFDGAFYLIPETQRLGAIRLYRAVEFPWSWEFVTNLVVGDHPADPTLFLRSGRWWLLFSNTDSDSLYLYESDKLLGPWKQHPKSPIVCHDPRKARLAGGIVEVQDRLFRFAQDCSEIYGGAVGAFEILMLSPTEYVERPHTGNPILSRSKNGWNSHSMHQLSACRLESGRWLAAVDGSRRSVVVDFSRNHSRSGNSQSNSLTPPYGR